MDFKNKYLKYKNKYVQLKQLLGGYTPEKDTLNEMEKYCKNGTFISHDLKNLQNYSELQQFFNNVKDGKKLYLVPEKFDDFMGIKDYNLSHLNKLWFRLNQKPSLYKINSWKPLTLLNDIYLDNKKITNLIVKKNVTLQKTVKEIFEKMTKITDKEKSKDQDQIQISGFNNISSALTIDLKYKDEFEKRLENYEGEEGVFENNNIKYNYKYYKKFSILYVYNLDSDYVYLYMYNMKEKDDTYEIFPFPYTNLLLNDNYESAVKSLFDEIVNTLNKITQSNKYDTLPDGFFHIHVTIPDNQNRYILLTIHGLYEILSDTPYINDKYLYKKGLFSNYSITRKGLDNMTDKDKKDHSFYILFDTQTNNHKLYQIKDLNKATDFFSSKQTIGIYETILGTNIIDINHIKNKGVLVTSVKKKCEYLCQPECPGDNCTLVNYNSNDYYLKLYGSDSYYLINNNGDKCASIQIKNRGEPDVNIFIDDIKVQKEFNLCKTGMKDIMQVITSFAKQQTPPINMITLDDASFMQFPQTYTMNSEAEFIWCVAYVKNRYDLNNNKLGVLPPTPPQIPYNFQPIKYSIYSVEQGFQIKVDSGHIEEVEEVQRYLDFCIGYYNTYIEKSPYDLVEKGKELSRRQINVRNGNYDATLTTDIDEYRQKYNKFKEFIDKKITFFKNIKFNVNRIVEDTLTMYLHPSNSDLTDIYGEDTTLDGHFIISDYYNPTDPTNSTRSSKFKIKYYNKDYSIEISIGRDEYFKGQNMENILNSGNNISLYDFLVNKNMITFYKTI